MVWVSAVTDVLCTFSGKYGDILWSLPTAKYIADVTGGPVDFGIMRPWLSICPLIETQPYIDKCFPVPGWFPEHERFGAQPWESPRMSPPYPVTYNLTYRKMPDAPLIDFIAYESNARLGNQQLSLPFLNAEDTAEHPTVTWGFGQHGWSQKMRFRDDVAAAVEPVIHNVKWVRVDKLPWYNAAREISRAHAFLGCKSALHVVAHGVGTPVFLVETADWRLDEVFSYPYADEPCLSVEDTAKRIIELVAL